MTTSYSVGGHCLIKSFAKLKSITSLFTDRAVKLCTAHTGLGKTATKYLHICYFVSSCGAVFLGLSMSNPYLVIFQIKLPNVLT